MLLTRATLCLADSFLRFFGRWQFDGNTTRVPLPMCGGTCCMSEGLRQHAILIANHSGKQSCCLVNRKRWEDQNVAFVGIEGRRPVEPARQAAF